MDKLICHDKARAFRANVNRILCLLELIMTITCINGTIFTSPSCTSLTSPD